MANRGSRTVLFLGLLGLCSCRDEPGQHYTPPGPWRCKVDGRCAGVENGASCPEDCDTACPVDLESLGPERIFVVQELRVPRTSEEARGVGADLDGDGEIDNLWGSVHRMIDNVLAPGGPADDAVARGELVMLARLRGDPAVEGGRVAVQILHRGWSAGPLRFDGTDEVLLLPPEPRAAWACGRVQDGAFYAGPAAEPTSMPLVLNNERPVVANVPLWRATLRGRLHGERLELTVGGGLVSGEIYAEAIPEVLAVAPEILAAPTPPTLEASLGEALDGRCSTELPGCPLAPTACEWDGVISEEEIRCSWWLSTILTPHTDLDGDGQGDVISIGYEASLVPAQLIGWCGDGARSPTGGEVCEGADLGGLTCASLELSAEGDLGCEECRLVTGGCHARCGDGFCHPEERAASCPEDCAFVGVGAGAGHSCAIRVDGRLFCWGANDATQAYPGRGGDRVPEPVLVDEVRDASVVALGDRHSCVLHRDGAVSCFGDDSHGQRGGGEAETSERWTTVDLPEPAVHLAAGDNHTCAVLEGGALVCWGDNRRAQLGAEPSMFVASPIPVAGLPLVRAAALGRAHTCARTREGQVYCFGDASYGQLGQAGLSVSVEPLLLDLPGPAVSVGAGARHSCAALLDGSARCWGAGDSGQLGGTGGSGVSVEPVVVRDLLDASELEGGFAHTCALRPGLDAWCWGAGSSGQIGNGAALSRPYPVPVIQLADPVALAVGEDHACAISGGGVVLCWGDNRSGQLGLGTSDVGQSATPQAPLGL